MKKRLLASILALVTMTSLCSCGANKTGMALKDIAKTEQPVQLSVPMDSASTNVLALNNALSEGHGQTPRTELDQLRNMPNIRSAIDDLLDIAKFASNSKNGCIYIDNAGNWTGNTTLLNAFKNKVFVNDYWVKKLKESESTAKLCAACSKEFGINMDNTNYALLLSLNVYYDLFTIYDVSYNAPLDIPVSRGEAMGVLYKAETPVGYPCENKYADFANDEYAPYASQVEDFCYLTTEDGSLNSYTYHEPMTKAEIVYMLVKKYYPNEYDNMSLGNSYEGIRNRGDLFNSFDVDKGPFWKMQSLEACLQHPEDGLSEDLLKALAVGREHGMIGRVENWYEPYTRYDFLLTLTSAYEHMYTDATFPVTAEMGKNNAGKSQTVELGHGKEETEIKEVKKEQIEDAVSLKNLREVYGQEIDMTQDEIDKLIEMSDEYDPVENDDGKYHYEIMDEYKFIRGTGDYGFLNFRYGPEITYEMMTRIPEGTKVHVIARCVETGWYRVISGDTESGEGSRKVGYQCDGYLYDE